MEAIRCIMSRRSIRRYAKRRVPPASIRKMLEAAMNAPSACNQQAWQFLVITDKERLEGLADLHPYAQMLRQVSCAIVVCGDLRAEHCHGYWVQDCAAATQNILLAAHALGLGSVWCGVHPRTARVKSIQRYLGLPTKVVPLSLIPVGYPQERPHPAKRYQPSKVHQNRW